MWPFLQTLLALPTMGGGWPHFSMIMAIEKSSPWLTHFLSCLWWWLTPIPFSSNLCYNVDNVVGKQPLLHEQAFKSHVPIEWKREVVLELVGMLPLHLCLCFLTFFVGTSTSSFNTHVLAISCKSDSWVLCDFSFVGWKIIGSSINQGQYCKIATLNMLFSVIWHLMSLW